MSRALAQTNENPESTTSRGLAATGENTFANLPIDSGTLETQSQAYVDKTRLASILPKFMEDNLGITPLNKSELPIGEEISKVADTISANPIIDSESKADLVSFFEGIATGNTDSISQALRSIAENPNSPESKKLKNVLTIFGQGMQQIGFEPNFDKLDSGRFSLSAPDLKSGAKQKLEITKDQAPNALQFFSDTFKKPEPPPVGETEIRASRIEHAMSSSLNSISPLKAAIVELANSQSPQRSDELVSMLKNLAGNLTKFDSRLPSYTREPLVEAKFNESDGSFFIRLKADKNMTFRMEKDGTTRVEGATNLEHFLLSMDQLRSKNDIKTA